MNKRNELIKNKSKYFIECLELFLVFFKIGFFAFGGGLAILKIYENEFVEKRKWLTKEELLDYYILSQVTPGIIIVNTSSFIGYKLKKQLGIFISLIGVITPAIIIINLIAMFMQNFMQYEITNKILHGMNIGVTAVLVSVFLELINKNVNNIFLFMIFIISFISTQFFNISVLVIVICSAIFGLFYTIYQDKKVIKNIDKISKE